MAKKTATPTAGRGEVFARATQVEAMAAIADMYREGKIGTDPEDRKVIQYENR